MNDSTIPGCISNYGAPTFSNGPCETCNSKEVCKKCTQMNKELKAELLGKVDDWLDIVRGDEAK